MLDRFALFRGPPEPLPASLAQEMSMIDGVSALAQRTPLLTQRVWAVPTVGRVCLVGRNRGEAPTLGCSRVRHVLKEGTFIASVPAASADPSSSRTVVGLAPDGIRVVRIHFARTHPKAVPVIENTFALRDKGKDFPESIELIK